MTRPKSKNEFIKIRIIKTWKGKNLRKTIVLNLLKTASLQKPLWH